MFLSCQSANDGSEAFSSCNLDIYFTFSSLFGSLFIQYRSTPIHYLWFQPFMQGSTNRGWRQRLQFVQMKQKLEQDVCDTWKCQAVDLKSLSGTSGYKALDSFFFSTLLCSGSFYPYKNLESYFHFNIILEK